MRNRNPWKVVFYGPLPIGAPMVGMIFESRREAREYARGTRPELEAKVERAGASYGSRVR